MLDDVGDDSLTVDCGNVNVRVRIAFGAVEQGVFDDLVLIGAGRVNGVPEFRVSLDPLRNDIPPPRR